MSQSFGNKWCDGIAVKLSRSIGHTLQRLIWPPICLKTLVYHIEKNGFPTISQQGIFSHCIVYLQVINCHWLNINCQWLNLTFCCHITCTCNIYLRGTPNFFKLNYRKKSMELVILSFSFRLINRRGLREAPDKYLV